MWWIERRLVAAPGASKEPWALTVLSSPGGLCPSLSYGSVGEWHSFTSLLIHISLMHASGKLLPRLPPLTLPPHWRLLCKHLCGQVIQRRRNTGFQIKSCVMGDGWSICVDDDIIKEHKYHLEFKLKSTLFGIVSIALSDKQNFSEGQ